MDAPAYGFPLECAQGQQETLRVQSLRSLIVHFNYRRACSRLKIPSIALMIFTSGFALQ